MTRHDLLDRLWLHLILISPALLRLIAGAIDADGCYFYSPPNGVATLWGVGKAPIIDTVDFDEHGVDRNFFLMLKITFHTGDHESACAANELWFAVRSGARRMRRTRRRGPRAAVGAGGGRWGVTPIGAASHP
jgi:hypothetical protein